MKLSKSLEEGICPPTRQGDRVRPTAEVLYHRMVAMSSKKGLELLGGGDSRLGGVGGRSGEEAIRQIGGTGFFRRVFRIPRALKRTLLSLPEGGGMKCLVTLFRTTAPTSRAGERNNGDRHPACGSVPGVSGSSEIIPEICLTRADSLSILNSGRCYGTCEAQGRRTCRKHKRLSHIHFLMWQAPPAGSVALWSGDR